MKTIIKKITAALCVGALISTSPLFSTVAADEANEITLPSGLTISEFTLEINQQNEEVADFASAAVGVFKGNEVVYKNYFGEADKENNIPADDSAVYEWGSITKTLIWVSVMQLWEEGKLDLERDVREYLPEGFFRNLSYNDPITMMDLMNHSAGWQEVSRPMTAKDENNIPDLESSLKMIEPIQVNRPGEVAAYSNYGAAVAGYIVECVSGIDFCEYVHKNIFEPLGMEQTALNPAHSDNQYVYEQRKKIKSYSFSFGKCIDKGNKIEYITAYPAGSATGSLNDLIIYAQALADKNAPLFKNKETQEIMFTGTDFYGESDIPINCHGFWCTEYGVRTYGHSGATYFGQANMLIDPVTETGLVVMVNEEKGNWYLNTVPYLVFGELSPEKYASGIPEKAEVAKYYLVSRSIHKGVLKFASYLSAYPTSVLGEPEDLGNGLYQFRAKSMFNDKKEVAVLAGKKTMQDGTVLLEQASIDLIPDNFFILSLSLFTLYLVMALSAIFMLLIRLKKKKHGRWKPYAGSAVVNAGHFARLISVILVLVLYMIFGNELGVKFSMEVVIGTIQIICMVVCIISALSPLIFIRSQKEKARPLYSIINALCNIITVATIIFFDMYRFW